MSTQTYIGTLTVIECGTCFVTFGMTPQFITARERDHRTWYCPNGHERYYPAESDVERAKREAREAKAQAERERLRREATRDQLDAETRSHRATRGHLTRQRKRAAHGVCPCCSRTFADVARHVASKHPEYVKAVS